MTAHMEDTRGVSGGFPVEWCQLSHATRERRGRSHKWNLNNLSIHRSLREIKHCSPTPKRSLLFCVLTTRDGVWNIELLPARYVKVSTSIGGNKGPTLRLALLTMLPEDQAAIIHEAAVGRSQARVDIRDYRQRKAAVRERKNARRRLKRATDTEWCASERQKTSRERSPPEDRSRSSTVISVRSRSLCGSEKVSQRGFRR